MAQPYEEEFQKVLRWMRENLNLVSAIYQTTSGTLAFDPAVTLGPKGMPIRGVAPAPGNVGSWLLNSVTGLVACCYMDALGKVGQQGKRPYSLNGFAQAHMPDLVAECTAKGGDYTLNTLYVAYRCGFAHTFASANAVWDRLGRNKEYWFPGPKKPGLNVDRLADGVVAGIDHFEAWFNSQVAAGGATYEKFFEWLDA